MQTEREGITRKEWQSRLTLVSNLLGVLVGAHDHESKEILRASGGVEVLAGVLLGTPWFPLHPRSERKSVCALCLRASGRGWRAGVCCYGPRRRWNIHVVCLREHANEPKPALEEWAFGHLSRASPYASRSCAGVWPCVQTGSTFAEDSSYSPNHSTTHSHAHTPSLLDLLDSLFRSWADVP